jgi:hypothetical protein
MKHVFKFMFVLSFLVIAAGLPLVAVSAAGLPAPVHQETAPVLPSLPDLMESMKNLGGIALLFAAGFNTLKSVGWLKDNQAPTASLIFNTATLLGLVGLQIAGRADVVPVIDESAGTLATIITSVFALYYQLWVTRQGHTNVLAGLPVIGHSFSKRSAGEGIVVEVSAA